MKKILILLLLLGTYLFVSVDLFASSYNDPIANQGVIDLETPLTILNNHTLKYVFEDNNLFYFNYSGSTVQEWDNFTYKVDNINQYSYNNMTFNANKNYYISYSIKLTAPINYMINRYNDINYIWGDPNNITDYQKYTNKFYNTSVSLWFPYVNDTNYDDYYLIKSLLVLDLDDLGLNNLSKTQIDYFYTLYQLFKLGIDPTVFYNQGEDFGYMDGYTDGLVEGYYDGEAQGLIDGYNSGYNIGYNEGIDYAVTENISLLSVFELIFGVALNMLTFIITIDVFGISILSIISTLALFVGVVWLLKMIRG